MYKSRVIITALGVEVAFDLVEVKGQGLQKRALKLGSKYGLNKTDADEYYQFINRMFF